MISHTLFYAYHCTFFRLSPLGTECNFFLSRYQSITSYLFAITITTTLSPLLMIIFYLISPRNRLPFYSFTSQSITSYLGTKTKIILVADGVDPLADSEDEMDLTNPGHSPHIPTTTAATSVRRQGEQELESLLLRIRYRDLLPLWRIRLNRLEPGCSDSPAEERRHRPQDHRRPRHRQNIKLQLPGAAR